MINCAVRTKSKKERERVEQICAQYDISWELGIKPPSGVYNTKKAVYFCIGRFLSYTYKLNVANNKYIKANREVYSYDDFVFYFDKSKMNAMKGSIVQIKTANELYKVESVCSKYNIYWDHNYWLNNKWIADGLHIDFNCINKGKEFYICIDNALTFALSISTENKDLPMYSVKEFVKKFDKFLENKSKLD